MAPGDSENLMNEYQPTGTVGNPIFSALFPNSAIRLISTLLLFVPGAFAVDSLTVTLSNGKIFTGLRSFENEKFLTVNVKGSDIRILKSMIEEISVDVAGEVTESDEAPLSRDREAGISEISGRVKSAGVEVLLVNSESITWLDMSYEGLSKLNPRISFLTNLTYLDLKGNNLHELPESIGDLTYLRVLDLRFNKLRELPPHLGNLTGLEYLFLSENRFSHRELAHLEQMLPTATIVHTRRLEKKKGKPLPITVEEGAYADSLKNICQSGAADACAALAEFWFAVNDWERGILACEWGCPLDRSELAPAGIACCEKAAELNAEILELPIRAAMFYRRICESSTPQSTDACIELEKLK